MIMKFHSTVNNVAKGTVYELYEWNDDYYLVKWRVGGDVFQRKYLRTKINEWFENKEFVAIKED